MEWLNKLSGQLVAVDTAPFIYLIEGNPKYLSAIEPFFAALDQGRLHGITSTVTLLEVLVQPFRKNDQELARRYREILLKSRGLTIIPLSAEIAEQAAEIRAHSNLRTADAIQIAVARSQRAASFLTNDRQLLAPAGLDVLIIDELISA
jgi:predicted nucleic acid-binding protein